MKLVLFSGFLVQLFAGAGCGQDSRPADTQSAPPTAVITTQPVNTQPFDAHAATLPAADSSVPNVLDRSIRIKLLDGRREFQIALEQPFDLIDAFTGQVLRRYAAVETLTVQVRDGRLYFREFEWAADTAMVVDLVPRGDGVMGIAIEDAVPSYRGRLRFWPQTDGTAVLINIVDMEDYLVGVVAGELGASFHPEAMKAQAIAARTYAWYQKTRAGRRQDWDVVRTTASQVYSGLQRRAQVPWAQRAVRATCGLVCTWDSPQGEQIFCTYYSSTCGGYSQSIAQVRNQEAIPPLAGGVACDFCEISPNYRWQTTRLSKQLITRRLRDRYPTAFNAIGPIDRVEVIARNAAGRPTRLDLVDAAGNAVELEAENFRLAVDPRVMKSTWCEPINDGEHIAFTQGRGYGHGMGMCQYGAEGQARAGRSAAQILHFYYPQSRLCRAY